MANRFDYKGPFFTSVAATNPSHGIAISLASTSPDPKTPDWLTFARTSTVRTTRGGNFHLSCLAKRSHLAFGSSEANRLPTAPNMKETT